MDPSVGDAHGHGGARGDVGHGGQHAAVGALEHGVPALQRGQRRQRPGSCAVVGDLVGGPVQAVPGGAQGPLAQRVDLVGAAGQQRPGVGERRAGAEGGEQGGLPVEVRSNGPPQPVAAHRDDPQLLGHVGHDQLGGVGRRGRAHVGDQVEQRLVGLVADGRDDGRAALRDRTDQPLVGERQQVLDRAAAARDHDHVDAGVAVQAVDGGHHLGGGAGALHGGVRRLEDHRGPAAAGVLDDVALGGRVGCGDQADAAGQERQAALELGGEQPLGGQQLAATLEAGEQLAETDQPDLPGFEGERAAVGVVRRLGLHHDARALGRRSLQGVEDRARTGHRDGDVGHRVAQGQEDLPDPGPAVDLGDLALDPDDAQLVDPAGHGLGDLADGGRRLR